LAASKIFLQFLAEKKTKGKKEVNVTRFQSDFPFLDETGE
jgi:hypothetical protein